MMEGKFNWSFDKDDSFEKKMLFFPDQVLFISTWSSKDVPFEVLFSNLLL